MSVGGHSRASVRDPVRHLEHLVDEQSLQLDPANGGAAVISGAGLVRGQPVRLFACNPRLSGGALGVLDCSVIVQAVDNAVHYNVPVVGIWHSGGARLQEGTTSLDGIGRVFRAVVRASGRVPQISVVLGPSAGGAAYGAALTDFVVAGPEGRLFVTGPDIVQAVTGQRVDAETLGGPHGHASRSGVLHAARPTDGEALSLARSLLEILSDRQTARAGRWGADERMNRILPDSPRRAYDMHRIVELLLDDDPGFIEIHECWARNVMTGFGRVDGLAVGVVANNPIRLGGCLDATASDKAARFVRTCDALGMPLVVLVDVPGYLPGLTQELDGVVRRGAKLLHAFADAAVPRVTVVVRKAFGGAFIAMNSKALGATAVFAWPSAEVGVMYPAAAVAIVHKRLLASVPTSRRAGLMEQLQADYERTTDGLSRAVACGHVDAVIDQRMTRVVVADTLRTAAGARGSHTNIPL